MRNEEWRSRCFVCSLQSFQTKQKKTSIWDSSDVIEDYAQPLLNHNEPVLHKNINSGETSAWFEDFYRGDCRSDKESLLQNNRANGGKSRLSSSVRATVQGISNDAHEAHFNSLANLNEEFATIVTTKEISQALE